ncbi:diguanylate cyclase (GGDEF)-like protein [Rhodopseudomonas rhenobacensis]|uniref:diguanylate cyclase n=2 Tax=Rhodopseudomonas rhenobacensis TaxID=87461 RepID=A0A7W7Z4G1_9BRAD|nr:GGDEF domain-containing protein [Rhodopseudomonas rhenobacensis]MBB5047769.1 diguanylate cyclase (GGDEF)-like protein [Rhodopseudomonas rhenobacensis]
MLDLAGLSYVIDAGILLIYAAAGTVPTIVGPALAGCGLATVAIFLALSEFGISDRLRDHYCVVPQATINLVIMLSFAELFPQVGVLFLCSLFVVYGFSSLRSTPRQAAIAWTLLAIGLTALFVLSAPPITLPMGSTMERFATMLVFLLALGRCMYIGVLAATLRDKLYKRGVELKATYRRIEELAELDELTGAYNRRCIMRMLDDALLRARDDAMPLTIALIDLDWFKRINDLYGHPTGDEVLRTFAITIFANIREVDRFGRYGGEEFLLVLPGTTQDGGYPILERLREIVAALDWSAFSEGMAVTMSVGIATLDDDETPEALLARADDALYEAKAHGRNRVVQARPACGDALSVRAMSRARDLRV